MNEKKAILIFLDGTVCDMRHRIPLMGTPEFFSDENVMKDTPTVGAVKLCQELAEDYSLVYIGARPAEYVSITAKWLASVGFPEGEVTLGKNQAERMESVKQLKKKYTFHAGIGDRYDDNELHLELGCKSFILKEWEPDFDTVRKVYLKKELQESAQKSQFLKFFYSSYHQAASYSTLFRRM